MCRELKTASRIQDKHRLIGELSEKIEGKMNSNLFVGDSRDMRHMVFFFTDVPST